MAEEKSNLPARIFRKPEDLNQALVSKKDSAHLLTPYAKTSFDVIARGGVPELRSTYLDPDPDTGHDVYKSWERPGELAITKIGLTKLGQLAGVNWLESYRVDDGKDPHFAEYHAKAEITDIDGTVMNAEASRAINLRDGSPEALKMKDKELVKARQNISALSESKAKNRVLRELLGLAQSYKPDEIRKPFVVLKLVPDMDDPEVRQMVYAKRMGLEKLLFAKPEEPSIPVQPSGTQGLNLPALPGDQPQQKAIDISATTVTEIPEARAKMIKRVEDLYYMTNLTRDPGKVPIKDLPDVELEKLMNALLTKPVVRQVPAKEEDLI